MTETMLDTLTLVVRTCCRCGVRFGIPEYLDTKNRERKSEWFCPNGHGQVYRTTEVDKLREQLRRQEAQTDCWQTRSRNEAIKRRTAQRSNQALKGVVTRTRNRIAAGVCPYCNRTFVGSRLTRHIKTKHPESASGGKGGDDARRK